MRNKAIYCCPYFFAACIFSILYYYLLLGQKSNVFSSKTLQVYPRGSKHQKDSQPIVLKVSCVLFASTPNVSSKRENAKPPLKTLFSLSIVSEGRKQTKLRLWRRNPKLTHGGSYNKIDQTKKDFYP